MLREQQLAQEANRERQVQLRLELAWLLGVVEEQGGRLDLLRRNLDERPGHMPTIEALAAVLEQRGRFEELWDLYSRQAGSLDTPAAAGLWDRAALLAAQD